ncbi:MAG TPA: phosphate uptake regulator PhoU [Bacillota bacterium]|nr:phosphate uptake regulator PhoU [Bacillota bacterium]
MLTRQNYYQEKRSEIKRLVLQILSDLAKMTDHFEHYLKQPTKENKNFILDNENYVDKNEKRIEKHILEIISLEQLDTNEIKWLLSMNRIIRELERVGDQLTNIITISDVIDTDVLRPTIKRFFHYEQDMIRWLTQGIETNDAAKLQDVIAHDEHVNHLNKETYQQLVDRINEKEELTESKLKIVIISRFLERIGDHLVNAARTYREMIEDYK